jgi:hypothetical protein
VRRILVLAVLFAAACQNQSELKKQTPYGACKKNLDCNYGLECIEGGKLADGGVASASGKTCQYHSFGDCEGDGSQPGPDGQPQCLHTYKCREGHCTVQCAGHQDCKEGEVCKVGICTKGGSASNNCYDNRDCPYPETCYYGQCVTRAPSQRCSSDLDCNPGQRCFNATCQ